jgi:hypothetical protein
MLQVAHCLTVDLAHAVGIALNFAGLLVVIVLAAVVAFQFAISRCWSWKTFEKLKI